MELIKAKSPKEIAGFYGITTRALRYRLAPYKFFFKKNKRKRIFSPAEVNFIYGLFGSPIEEV